MEGTPNNNWNGPPSALMTEMVLPQDSNTHGKLLGGRLLHWMDMTATLAAKRHAHRPVLTVAVDLVRFIHPASIGDYVVIKASLTRVFRTSMEIEVHCYLQQPIQQSAEKLICQGYFTFVALDENKRPVILPPFTPKSEAEQNKWTAAGTRREYRRQTQADN